MALPTRVGAKIAQLIGAKPNEVIAGDSTSINVYKLTLAALSANAGRRRIVTAENEFPTDQYVLQEAMRRTGQSYQIVRVAPAEICRSIDDDTALVLLSHVDYRTADIRDMTAINARAQMRSVHALGPLPQRRGDRRRTEHDGSGSRNWLRL